MINQLRSKKKSECNNTKSKNRFEFYRSKEKKGISEQQHKCFKDMNIGDKNINPQEIKDDESRQVATDK